MIFNWFRILDLLILFYWGLRRECICLFECEWLWDFFFFEDKVVLLWILIEIVYVRKSQIVLWMKMSIEQTVMYKLFKRKSPISRRKKKELLKLTFGKERDRESTRWFWDSTTRSSCNASRESLWLEFPKSRCGMLCPITLLVYILDYFLFFLVFVSFVVKDTVLEM